MYKILVTGDRNWDDFDLILQELLRLKYIHGKIMIAHGGARGADNLAGRAAKGLGIVVEYPADWVRLGKFAGPVRNHYMYNNFQPDLVLAFHDDLESSKGTKEMVNYAKSKGCKIRYVSHELQKMREQGYFEARNFRRASKRQRRVSERVGRIGEEKPRHIPSTTISTKNRNRN